jgi:CRP/FNR family cyclic AMP-dependent transcriptional regulator
MPVIEKGAYYPILKQVTIFSGIADKELHTLVDKCETIQYPAGTRIIQEGSDAKEIFIILDGKVKIVMDADKEALEILELGTGNCIGEASVIGIQPHSASVVAVDETTLLVLSRQILMDVQRTDKDLFSLLVLNLARELARRLHHTDQILLLYSKDHGKHN